MKDIKIIPPHSQKNWNEDFEYENGCYQNVCIYCAGIFYGYKRRLVCKECFYAPQVQHTIDATGTFKISPKWDNNCGIPFDSLIADAAFAFTVDRGHVRIVTQNNYNGVNCFAIGYDRWGLIEYGESKFNNSWGKQILDSSANIINFIKLYLIEEGAQELIVKK